MGWDVLVFGTLKIAPKQIDEWLELSLDGSKHKWKRGWFAKDDSPKPPATVKAALEVWKKMTARGDHVLDVAIGKGTVKVRGLLPKEEFIYRAQRYALPFRVAEEVRATGDLTFVGIGNSFTWRLSLNGAKPATLEEVDEDLEESPKVIGILSKLPLPKSEPKKKKGKAGPPLELDAATKKVLAEIEKRVRMSVPTDTSLEAQAEGHCDAIAAFAKLDRAAALPLLLRLSEPTVQPYIRAGALHALAGDKSPAVVTRLLEAFAAPAPKKLKGFPHPPGVRYSATEALLATKLPIVAERLLALLTDKALAIPIGPTGDYHDSSTKAFDMQELVTSALHVIGKLGHQPAWDRVAHVFKKHPLWEVRQQASRTLFALSTNDEIEKTFGKDKRAFLEDYSTDGETFNALAWDKLTKQLLRTVRNG